MSRKDMERYLAARGLDPNQARNAKLTYWTEGDLKKANYRPWKVGAICIPYLEPRTKDASKARVRGQRVRYLGDVAGGERYRQPARQKGMLYFPPALLYPDAFDWSAWLEDPDTALFITEGEVCACKAMAEGFVTVALPGIWNWLDKQGPIKDLDRFAWHGLDVVLVPDGDVATNASVAEATSRLREELQRRGVADVLVATVPDGMDWDEFLTAQGGDAFDQIVRDAGEQGGEAMRCVELLNGEMAFCFSPQPNVVRVHDFIADGELNIISQDAARQTAEHLYGSDRVVMPRVGHEKRGRPKHPYTVWMHSPLANRVQRVVFDPAKPPGVVANGIEGQKVFNCFKGWPEPAPGSVRYFERLLDACFGKDERGKAARAWFLDWCAYPLQNPGAKLYSAVVVYGPQGCGKTFLGRILEACHGKSGSVITAEMVANRFNDYLQGKTFLRVEEMHVDGRQMRPIKSRLKGFITEDTMWVEPKGLQRFRILNAANFYFSSNEPGAIPVDHDDRRYFVWRWRGMAPEEFYTRRLAPWVWEASAKGTFGWQAVLQWLLDREIDSEFQPSMRPPSTPDKVSMMERTETPAYTFARVLRDTPTEFVPKEGTDWLSIADMRQLFARRFGEQGPDARIMRRAFQDVYQESVEHRANLGPGYSPREVYLIAFRNLKKWRKDSSRGAVVGHYRRRWADLPTDGAEGRFAHVAVGAESGGDVHRLEQWGRRTT